MEQTYFMIKPEIVAAEEQQIGSILRMVNEAGFRIVEMATRQLDRPTAEKFYGEHAGKDFFPALIAYITSGPVVAVRLQREEAVRRLRELVGATDPQAAATGTIRFLYGRSIQNNSVHASATREDSERELTIIFG
jgi:nucleoside-diphosphate kinase